MAVIVGEGVQREPKSPLSYAPLDRAMDCLKLAQMGDMQCRRTWNDFAQESPGTARVVAAAVAKDNEVIAKATARADAILSRGEFITKGYTPPPAGKRPGKPKKAGKAARRAAQTELLTKAAGTGRTVHTRDEAVAAMLEQDLYSDDPGRRLIASQILGRIR